MQLFDQKITYKIRYELYYKKTKKIIKVADILIIYFNNIFYFSNPISLSPALLCSFNLT